MTWTKKRRLVRKYDRDRHLYDMMYFEEQKAKMLASLSKVSINPKDLVLDVGCGTGILFELMANSSRLTVGLDFSKGLLSAAKERAGNYGNVELILGDTDYLPLRNESFDGIFAFTLLQNISTPSKTMREMIRVCRVGGCMVISGLKKRFSRGDFKALIRKHALNPLWFIDDANLKDYLVICEKTKAHL